MKKVIIVFISIVLASVMLTACDSKVPYIGENGNWWVGESDLEIPAQGPQGETGEKGENGEPGSSVTVQSVKKTKTEAAVDTYTIYFSDGTKSTFTVTNGKNGTNGTNGTNGKSVYITSVEKESSDGLTDSYKILFSDNTVQRFSVTNGQSITIQSIGKTGTQGLVDTYQICFSDGKSLSFTVTNGADGLTPYIGSNGNWWIGEEDTGTCAGTENMDRVGTDGLLFRLTIRGGVAGYEVYGYQGTETDIVIPNLIFGQPVVSIASGALPSGMTSLSISSNTEYLPPLKGNSYLASVDFNHAPISVLPNEMFRDCSSLQELENYENLKEIGSYAFKSTLLTQFDFSNITTIGNYAFYGCKMCDDDWGLLYADQYFVFLPEQIISIGSYAFDDDFPVYYEGTTAPVFTSDGLQIGVKHSADGYYYQDKGDYLSVLNYDGDQTLVKIPQTINGKTVKALTDWAFFGNPRIERVEIPSTVTQIGRECFLFCRKIHSIFVPESVVSFGHFDDEQYSEDLFENPTFFFEANTIDFSGGITSPEQLDILKYMLGVQPSEIDDDEVCVYYKKATSYEVVTIKNVNGVATIPASHNGKPVSRINTYALAGDEMVKGVVLEKGISKISTNAFYKSGNLIFVDVPSSVEIVNYRGFYSLSKCTIYIEASEIPTDWDSSWYYSIKDYKLDSKAEYSSDGSYLYTTVDQKLYLVKYLKPIEPLNPIVIPETIDGVPVYGICSYCFEGTQSNNSNNRYIFAIPASISVMESDAIYLPYPGYSILYMGVKSRNQIPSGWNSNWFKTSYYGYGYNSSNNIIYYADSWEMVNDTPVVIAS